jgi:hypothetical protein
MGAPLDLIDSKQYAKGTLPLFDLMVLGEPYYLQFMDVP